MCASARWRGAGRCSARRGPERAARGGRRAHPVVKHGACRTRTGHLLLAKHRLAAGEGHVGRRTWICFPQGWQFTPVLSDARYPRGTAPFPAALVQPL